VTLVDGDEVERLLQSRVVEIELLVELGDEAVRLLAVGVELPVRGRGRNHEFRRIRSGARDPAQDRAPHGAAAAALVYVPHTTAGVTINEHADPAVAQDLESALEKVVDDGWDWKHVEDPDGPNAPSHIRASLMSPQILVPIDNGKLALGTWQGIFFCEFDGPRERKVYVTPLT
jgi:secondary thiamine-phosphate synthase enzyme